MLLLQHSTIEETRARARSALLAYRRDILQQRLRQCLLSSGPALQADEWGTNQQAPSRE